MYILHTLFFSCFQYVAVYGKFAKRVLAFDFWPKSYAVDLYDNYENSVIPTISKVH